ncbi:YdcF family protein [Nitrosophilus alvini]|uniref:YdcF family protein n=1 Tax=Nitrosophilus alvini TaxID=2714855 RepID=UPI00190966DF|nr:YdcF family protein [Nitrosophilus alvini]
MIYIVSKLFTYLLLPPGIFILILAASAFFAKRFRKILLFSALVFWLFSTDFVPHMLLKPLEYKSFQNSDTKPNAVVVLGGGDVNFAPNLPLTADGTKRVLWGFMEAKKRKLPLIYSGVEKGAEKCFDEINSSLGLGFENSHRLKAMCYYLENVSRDTFENAKYTKDIFKKKGIKNPKIVLVTSAYHMPRAKKLFEYFGFEVEPSATDYKTGEKLKIDIWSFFPKMRNFKDSYIALHEYFGLLSLFIRGVLI